MSGSVIKRGHHWKILYSSFFLLIALGSFSQDIRFSEYFLNDLSTNPGSAGDFDGDYRLTGVHRNQWRSVTTPFSTFQLAGDARDFMKTRKLGLGVRILNDRTGDSQFNTFSVSITGSNILSMNADSSLRLHSGLQLGYTQQRIDYEGLRFDEQFNGFSYDPNRGSGEQVDRDIVRHADVHVGMYLKKRIESGRYWSLGFSIWNLSTPDVSFRDDEAVYLSQRLSIHGSYSIKLDDKWDILPAGRAMFQGPYQEYIIGGRLRHTWECNSLVKRRAYLGGFIRIEDAAFIAAGIEHDQWTIGMSYDINLSSLEVASNNRGAFEVTAIYIFDVFDEKIKAHRKCLDLL